MNKAILLLSLFLLLIKCQCENSRSVFLRKFLGIKYICNESSYSPSIIIFGKNQRQCEISCLNYLQCYLLTFDLSNSQCEIFSNISIDYGKLIQQQNVITMITLDNEQLFNSMLSNTTKASNKESTMTSRITATSTNTGDTISTNRETATSSATTSTTTTSKTSTSSTTSSSTSSIKPVLQLVLRRVPQVLLPQLAKPVPQLVPPRPLRAVLVQALQLVLAQVLQAVLVQAQQLVLRRLLQAVLVQVLQLVLPRLLQLVKPVPPRLLRAVLVQAQQLVLRRLLQAVLVQVPQLVLPRLLQLVKPVLQPVPPRLLRAVLVQAQQLVLHRLLQLVKPVLQPVPPRLPRAVLVQVLQAVLVQVLQAVLVQVLQAVLVQVLQAVLAQVLQAVLAQVLQAVLAQVLQVVLAQVQQQQQIHVSISGSLLWNKTGITMLSSVTSPIAASGVFLDLNDTLYVADEAGNHVVWKLLKNAINATIVAGNYQSPGPNSTQLNGPNDVYVDRSGNIYVTDNTNYRIQKFSSGSNIGFTTAGINSSTGSALNKLAYPRYFTFDSTETNMYIADDNNHRVMRYSTSSTSGTNGTLAAGGAGPNNTNTSLNNPWGIYYLPSISNDLFITNVGGHSVIRWTPGASSGTFVAGVPGVPGSDSTHLNTPMGIRIDNYMNIYVVDYANHRVQLFCANTAIGITIAGNGSAGNGATQLNSPRGIAFDSAMNMYIGDSSNARVQKFMKL
ncbi:unnamed protein product [Adineta steineri]|uniref:Uncharacterized protein n=1 Tax=Adineta steineri TaxID=433720 RepID=A0A814HGQ5_9BILA|nr:unnamed protein product [Adineta steineri]CAF3977739.1 unnamed protein product [Adineta steineri]